VGRAAVVRGETDEVSPPRQHFSAAQGVDVTGQQSVRSNDMNRNVVHLYLLSLFALFLVGCVAPTAGTGASFSPPTAGPEAAVIVHYRKLESFGRGNTYELVYANKLLVRIGNGGYFVHKVSSGTVDYLSKVYREFSGVMIIPGVLENAARDLKPIHSVEVAAGKTYYVRWSVAPSGFAKVENVSAETGTSELQGLKAWTNE
jgi:hypothetical protein